jgi:hypothetical protein
VNDIKSALEAIPTVSNIVIHDEGSSLSIFGVDESDPVASGLITSRLNKPAIRAEAR